MVMNKTVNAGLAPTRLVDGKELLLAGLRRAFRKEGDQGVAALWEEFGPYIGKIPSQLGGVAYGVCVDAMGGTGGFDYLAGVEVNDLSHLLPGFYKLRIPAQQYAVFAHRQHVSKIHETIGATEGWLTSSGYAPIAAGGDLPRFFERYGETFDPQTGLGDMEIWVPIRG